MKAKWNIASFFAVAITTQAIAGCEFLDTVARVFSPERPAHATGSIGLDVGATYPHRDTSYDHLLKPQDGLSQEQLGRLFNHVAMPQSHSAMVGLLGYPIAEDGAISYWAIAGGSSELAVFYAGDIAYKFTVGY